MSKRGKELAAERDWANGNVPKPVKDNPEKDFIKPAAWIFGVGILFGGWVIVSVLRVF